MIFRFTLNNTIEGSHLIDEPDGWRDIALKLERSPEFHSLVEMIDSPFFFYNAGSTKDGGREYLSNIEDTQGINALVSLLVEVTENGTTYDTVFQANLDLSTIVDTSLGDKFYKFSCTLKPDDLWSMFLNRKSTKVDLKSSTDLDGNAVAASNDISLELTSQTIKQLFTASENLTIVDFTIPLGSSLQFAFDNIVLDEVTNKFNIPISDTTDPAPTFVFQYAGTYRFQIVMSVTQWVDATGLNLILNLSASGLLFNLKHTTIGHTTVYPSTRTDHVNATATGAYSKYTMDVTITAKANDEVAFYFYTPSTAFDPSAVPPNARVLIILGDNNAASGDARLAAIHDTSTITVTGNTTYPQTRSDAFLIHDAASAITKRIAPGFDIYSDYFGGSLQGYGANGCGYLYALMLGLHVRGYSFTDKPFAMSFNDWWNGANPIFNIGVGQETVSGNEVIRVEPKEHFYDDTPILFFSNVNNIERSYDQSMILKSIEIGYGNWSAESASGVDDPQTVHTYSTVFKIIGSEISQLSAWFAASLGIEQTRRNRAEQGKDWRLDNDIIIISIDKTSTSSPDLFIPEVNSPFTSITNLINPTTRYNVRLTPYRNFQRWIKYFSGCLQKYLTSVFRFNSGEGNYTTAVGANSDSCDTGTWSENQNISPSSAPYYTAEMWNLPSVSLSWTDYKTLRDNRHQGIAVSESTSDHKTLHIQSLKYDIAHAKATIKGWVKPSSTSSYTIAGSLVTGFGASWGISWEFQDSGYNISFPLPLTEILTITAGDTSLDVIVQKFTNGGIAQANGTVQFYQNAGLVHTTNFTNGQDVSFLTYTFASIADTDTFNIIITET